MSNKQYWLEIFTKRAGDVHKRTLARFGTRMYNKCTQWKNSLVGRSKKYGVECNITVDELRELLYVYYGTPCKYCGKRLDMNTMALDHVVPISKGGTSNIDNLQIICRTSNGMKGSLNEDNFQLLLDWLQTVSEELRKDISIRLARGVR